MPNASITRFDRAFQIRVDQDFLDSLDRILKKRGLDDRAKVIRLLVREADPKPKTKAR